MVLTLKGIDQSKLLVLNFILQKNLNG